MNSSSRHSTIGSANTASNSLDCIRFSSLAEYHDDPELRKKTFNIYGVVISCTKPKKSTNPNAKDKFSASYTLMDETLGNKYYVTLNLFGMKYNSFPVISCAGNVLRCSNMKVQLYKNTTLQLVGNLRNCRYVVFYEKIHHITGYRPRPLLMSSSSSTSSNSSNIASSTSTSTPVNSSSSSSVIRRNALVTAITNNSFNNNSNTINTSAATTANDNTTNNNVDDDDEGEISVSELENPTRFTLANDRTYIANMKEVIIDHLKTGYLNHVKDGIIFQDEKVGEPTDWSVTYNIENEAVARRDVFRVRNLSTWSNNFFFECSLTHLLPLQIDSLNTAAGAPTVNSNIATSSSSSSSSSSSTHNGSNINTTSCGITALAPTPAAVAAGVNHVRLNQILHPTAVITNNTSNSTSSSSFSSGSNGNNYGSNSSNYQSYNSNCSSSSNNTRLHYQPLPLNENRCDVICLVVDCIMNILPTHNNVNNLNTNITNSSSNTVHNTNSSSGSSRSDSSNTTTYASASTITTARVTATQCELIVWDGSIYYKENDKLSLQTYQAMTTTSYSLNNTPIAPHDATEVNNSGTHTIASISTTTNNIIPHNSNGTSTTIPTTTTTANLNCMTAFRDLHKGVNTAAWYHSYREHKRQQQTAIAVRNANSSRSNKRNYRNDKNNEEDEDEQNSSNGNNNMPQQQQQQPQAPSSSSLSSSSSSPSISSPITLNVSNNIHFLCEHDTAQTADTQLSSHSLTGRPVCLTLTEELTKDAGLMMSGLKAGMWVRIRNLHVDYRSSSSVNTTVVRNVQGIEIVGRVCADTHIIPIFPFFRDVIDTAEQYLQSVQAVNNSSTTQTVVSSSTQQQQQLQGRRGGDNMVGKHEYEGEGVGADMMVTTADATIRSCSIGSNNSSNTSNSALMAMTRMDISQGNFSCISEILSAQRVDHYRICVRVVAVWPSLDSTADRFVRIIRKKRRRQVASSSSSNITDYSSTTATTTAPIIAITGALSTNNNSENINNNTNLTYRGSSFGITAVAAQPTTTTRLPLSSSSTTASVLSTLSSSSSSSVVVVDVGLMQPAFGMRSNYTPLHVSAPFTTTTSITTATTSSPSVPTEEVVITTSPTTPKLTEREQRLLKRLHKNGNINNENNSDHDNNNDNTYDRSESTADVRRSGGKRKPIAIFPATEPLSTGSSNYNSNNTDYSDDDEDDKDNGENENGNNDNNNNNNNNDNDDDSGDDDEDFDWTNGLRSVKATASASASSASKIKQTSAPLSSSSSSSSSSASSSAAVREIITSPVFTTTTTTATATTTTTHSIVNNTSDATDDNNEDNNDDSDEYEYIFALKVEDVQCTGTLSVIVHGDAAVTFLNGNPAKSFYHGDNVDENRIAVTTTSSNNNGGNTKVSKSSSSNSSTATTSSNINKRQQVFHYLQNLIQTKTPVRMDIQTIDIPHKLLSQQDQVQQQESLQNNNNNNNNNNTSSSSSSNGNNNCRNNNKRPRRTQQQILDDERKANLLLELNSNYGTTKPFIRRAFLTLPTPSPLSHT